VEGQSKLKSRHPRKLPDRENTDQSKTQRRHRRSRSILLQLLSCTAEFQPSEMTYPLHLEVNTPDVASDTPRIQRPSTARCTGNTVFRSSKPQKNNTPYKKWKYPIDELIGKSMFFYEVQRSGILASDNRVTWRGHQYCVDFSEVGTMPEIISSVFSLTYSASGSQ
jgi:hypothetical protein